MPKNPHFHEIDISNRPIMDIGEIAAELASDAKLDVVRFAQLSGNNRVGVHVDVELRDGGIFRAIKIWSSIPDSTPRYGYYVESDVTEAELAAAISASIISRLMHLGVDPSTFIDGHSADEIEDAMDKSVSMGGGATDTTESASILLDHAGWILARSYEPETITG
jgi:hypothetical protein